jgi:hypothetical protein
LKNDNVTDFSVDFNYNCWCSSISPLNILSNTCILESSQLIRSLEIISPHYLGSDVDVFDELCRIFVDEKQEEIDDDNEREEIITENKKLWLISPIQPHLKRMKMNDW